MPRCASMSSGGEVLYLNGRYVPAGEAVVSVDDRAFLFADACYEVTLLVDGVPIALDRHLARLQRGLDELRIEFDAQTLVAIHHELIARNGLESAPMARVYVQVSRGVAPRRHAFPEGATPTVLVRASAIAGPSDDLLYVGTRAITAPDERWARVDIKTTGLLANVLAEQAAIDAGVDDVILHRGELVTEGSHTNVWGLVDGQVVTAPADHRILPGVTRGIMLELARDGGIDVDEREWTLRELGDASEVFMSSTTAGVRPIVEVDGRPVGSGRPGPITRQLQQLYQTYLDQAVAPI